jgi:hypothetical protein
LAFVLVKAAEEQGGSGDVIDERGVGLDEGVDFGVWLVVLARCAAALTPGVVFLGGESGGEPGADVDAVDA